MGLTPMIVRGSIRCCGEEQLYRNQETGDTACLAHGHLHACDCGQRIEHCALVGCGAWVCTDPIIRMVLEREYVNPSLWIH